LAIGTIKPDYTKPNPMVGVGVVEFSANGRYLLTRNGTPKLLSLTRDNMSQCLWIFDMQALRQKALIMQLTAHHHIHHIKWNPVYTSQFIFLSSSTLAQASDLVDESLSFLYYYRDDRIEIIEIPAG
jgi:hypothetical protein